jgi:transposase-like protein
MSQLEFIITRLKRFLNDPEKIVRNLIAINETKLKVRDKTIYLQLVIDVESKECLGVYVSETRNYLNAILFVRSILRFLLE